MGNPSVIDLMISQQMPPLTIVTNEGIWSGMSDHTPISTSTEHTTLRRQQNWESPIPYSMRTDATRLEKASILYRRELPRIQEQAKLCEKGDDINKLLERLNRTLLEPWEKRPRQVRRGNKEDWSMALQKKVGVRSKAYKAARRINTPEEWDTYKKVDREVKRMVRALRQNRRRSEMEALIRMGAQTASAKLSSMTRARKRRAQYSVQSGAPLDHR